MTNPVTPTEWADRQTLTKSRPIVGDYGGTDYLIEGECEYVRADLYESAQREIERLTALLREGEQGFGRLLISTSDNSAVRNWRKRVSEALSPGVVTTEGKP